MDNRSEVLEQRPRTSLTFEPFDKQRQSGRTLQCRQTDEWVSFPTVHDGNSSIVFHVSVSEVTPSLLQQELVRACEDPECVSSQQPTPLTAARLVTAAESILSWLESKLSGRCVNDVWGLLIEFVWGRGSVICTAVGGFERRDTVIKVKRRSVGRLQLR